MDAGAGKAGVRAEGKGQPERIGRWRVIIAQNARVGGVQREQETGHTDVRGHAVEPGGAIRPPVSHGHLRHIPRRAAQVAAAGWRLNQVPRVLHGLQQRLERLRARRRGRQRGRRVLCEIRLVLGDKRHDAALFHAVDIEKLDADPGTAEDVADNRPTADSAEGGQLEPHVHDGANAEDLIELQEGPATAEHHDAPTHRSRVASGGLDPHVHVKADPHAGGLPTTKRWGGGHGTLSVTPARSNSHTRSCTTWARSRPVDGRGPIVHLWQVPYA